MCLDLLTLLRRLHEVTWQPLEFLHKFLLCFMHCVDQVLMHQGV